MENAFASAARKQALLSEPWPKHTDVSFYIKDVQSSFEVFAQNGDNDDV